ncbi:MAG: hypothetical protein ACRD0J_18365 [Acidimicrobiales bacterium]
MATTEATFTAFLRDPKAVVAEVDHGDVVLRRRGAPALRLSLESRAQQGGEGVALVARLLGDVLTGPAREQLVVALAEEVPWLRLLPAHEREAFVVEFVEVAEAAAAVGIMAPLAALVEDWKATAAIHADPALATDLGRPLAGDGGLVPAPAIAG